MVGVVVAVVVGVVVGVDVAVVVTEEDAVDVLVLVIVVVGVVVGLVRSHRVNVPPRKESKSKLRKVAVSVHCESVSLSTNSPGVVSQVIAGVCKR